MMNNEEQEPKQRNSRFLLEMNDFPSLSRDLHLKLDITELVALVRYLELTPEQAFALLSAYGLNAVSTVKLPKNKDDE